MIWCKVHIYITLTLWAMFILILLVVYDSMPRFLPVTVFYLLFVNALAIPWFPWRTKDG